MEELASAMLGSWHAWRTVNVGAQLVATMSLAEIPHTNMFKGASKRPQNDVGNDSGVELGLRPCKQVSSAAHAAVREHSGF